MGSEREGNVSTDVPYVNCFPDLCLDLLHGSIADTFLINTGREKPAIPPALCW